MKRNRVLTSVIGMFAVGLASCTSTPPGPASVTPTAPTAVLTSAVATVTTPTLPAPKGVAISANRVTFEIPHGLGTGVISEVVPEVVGTTTGADWDVAPAHYRFTVQGYPVSAGQSNFDPILLIYPAKEYAAIRPAAESSLAALKSALAARTTPLTAAALPSIPFFNATLIMASNGKRVTFHEGSGIRALTHYAQAPTPVTNDYLFYQYQGLSADGKYYVIAILPVTAPFLQTNQQSEVPASGVALPQDAVAYDGYLAAIADRLTAGEQDGSLTPALSLLDAFIESIKLDAPAIVSPGNAPACNDQATFRNEENPKDDTAFSENARFIKQWTIYNTGTCAWDSEYTWVFVAGDQMGGADLTLEESIAVSNGGYTVFADLTAPTQPGTYTGYWGLRDGKGQAVPIVGGTKDNLLFVRIVVTGP